MRPFPSAVGLVRRRALAALVVLLGCLGLAGRADAVVWGPPVNLSPPLDSIGTDVFSPSVAVAHDGTTYAAYARYDGSDPIATVNIRPPGGAFGAPEPLSAAGGFASTVSVAVDPQGNATALWVRDGIVQARYRPAGANAWGAPQNLSSGGSFNASLAVGANGGAIAAWIFNDGTSRRVNVSVRQPGAASFNPNGTAISDNVALPADVIGIPQAAMDAAGDATVVWQFRDPTGMHYNIKSNSAAAGAAFNVGNIVDQSSPVTGVALTSNYDVVSTPGGRMIAVWDYDDGNGQADSTQVYFAERTPSPTFAAGTWSSAAKMAQPNGTRTLGPTIAVDDSGTAIAAWIAGNSGMPTAIVSAIRVGTGAWGSYKTLSGAGDAGNPLAAVSPTGSGIITWGQSFGGVPVLFTARRPAGGQFDDIQVAATGSTTPSIFFDRAQIGLDDQGNATAVWIRRDMSSGNVVTPQASVYDPVPPVIAALSVPTAGTAGHAVSMAGAAVDRMSGVALHWDFGDGSGADGAAVAHTYLGPGTFTVTLSATDAAGNRSTATQVIQVGAAGGPGGPGSIGGSSDRPRQVGATVTLTWAVLSSGRTRIKTLRVEGVAAGDVVRLSCTGKGCRKSAKRKLTLGRKAKRTLSLTKYVTGMNLGPNATLQIRIDRAGFISRIYRYRTARLKDPRKSTRCLAPGARKSTTC